MQLESKIEYAKLLQMEECPSDISRLRGTSFCAFYNTKECKRRKECSYYQQMQAKERKN